MGQFPLYWLTDKCNTCQKHDINAADNSTVTAAEHLREIQVAGNHTIVASSITIEQKNWNTNVIALSC